MSRLSEQPADGEQARPEFQAALSGAGQVSQAAQEQHFYYQDGVRRRRRTQAGEAVDPCPYPGLAPFEPEQARWFFGPYGLVLRDVRALATPVPCKGALGFWTLPTDVDASVAQQLARSA